MQTTKKTCFKCGQVKLIDEFYRHRAMGDGHLGKCKDCTKSYSIEHRQKNLSRYQQYDRDRANYPKRVALRESYAATESGAKSAAEAKRRWDKNNPKARAAKVAVSNAIRDRKVFPEPCFVCGCEKSQAHHSSYDLPLHVTWLCSKHHAQLHKEHRNILRASIK